MPIKEVERQLDERGTLGNLPRFGKLRKGAEKPQDDKGRLKDLDYFRLTLEPEYEAIIRPAFVELFGEQPTEFHNVLIAADDADRAFDYWYESWAHARLLNRCDGETIVVGWSDGLQGYDSTPRACTCDPLKRTCKQKGRMDIVIPALCEMTGVWGKLTLETTSQYDVFALRAAMRVAGAFLQRFEQISFWSVPFVVGRAPRNVPVTIVNKQGKAQRSLKEMSLLYALIEPEFNKVVLTPELTRPAQLLLNGVNPANGELPEITIEQTASWDREYVNAQTLHLFDHENHQANAIDKLIADGVLTDTMTDTEAITALLIERNRRDAEKQAESGSKNAPKSRKKGSNSSATPDNGQPDLEWAKDAQAVVKLIAQANQKFNFATGDVLEALRAITPGELDNLQDFVGTKQEAWAACIAKFCDYDSARVDAYVVGDMPEAVALRQLIHRQMGAAEIPF